MSKSTTEIDNDPFAPLPTRFDDKFANDGIWLHIEDEAGKDWPSFKLALLDTSSNRFLEVAERLQDTAPAPKNGFRSPAKLSKKEKVDAEASTFVKNFVEISMVDWTVKGRDGSVIPFTKDMAVKFFDHNNQDRRWLLKQCMEFASNIANYQPEDQAEAPEGN